MSNDSHLKFFKNKSTPSAENVAAHQAKQIGNMLADESPQEIRQHQRRISAFRKMFDQVLAERIKPGVSPDILWVTFKEFTAMQSEYADSVKTNDGSHISFPFQPLSAYQHKLVRKNKLIRPIFQNEVGTWVDKNGYGRVVVLKDMGPDDYGEKYFQVPKGDK